MPDVAVGTPWTQGLKDDPGRIVLCFLDAEGATRRQSVLSSQALLREAGVVPHFRLGASLACLGDLDGDGTIELASAQRWSPIAREARGVLLLSIDPRGLLKRARRVEEHPRGAFGSSPQLRTLGDLDGDGREELAVGVSGDKDGGEYRGAVRILFLAADGTLRRSTKISDWEGGFAGFLTDGSSFGRDLYAPGDVDGDGLPDLVVADSDGHWLLLLARDGTVRAEARF